MTLTASDVVLVPIPCRDKLAERTRPAVILSGRTYNQQGDLVVAAVTSHAARFPTDYRLLDWQQAGLQFPSTVRMLLTTVALSRVVLRIGQLSSRDWSEVQARLALVLS